MKKLLLTFVIFIYSSTTLAYADITTGLIAHYELENNANDTAGGDNTGTSSNVTYAAGKFGNAASFNGTSSKIDLNVTGFPTTGSYTISAWINPNQMGSRGIIGWGTYGNTSIHDANALRLQSSGIWHYWWYEDLGYTTGSLTNNWHHVVATWNSSTGKRSIYVDGVFGSTDTVTGFNAALINGAIGVTNFNEYFDGLIDEVKVYSRDLNQSDVTELFNYSIPAPTVSTPTPTPTPAELVQSFVERLYEHILSRLADKAGMDYWTSDLTTGGQSAYEVVVNFFESTEYLAQDTSDGSFVDDIYVSILDRKVDPAGYHYWVKKLKEGLTREEILDALLRSKEFEKLSKDYGVKTFPDN